MTQVVTLTGQTKKALDTPLYRSNRLFNDNGAAWDGDIYVFEDDTLTAGVPQTAAKIHLKASAEGQQSAKCATAVENEEYLIIMSLYGFTSKQQAAAVDFQFQQAEFAKVFRTRFDWSIPSTAGGPPIHLDPVLIVPPNSDARIRASVSANNTKVFGAFAYYSATVIQR